MARTESTMRALGTPAPDFSLPEVVHGDRVTPHAVRGDRPLLVIFLSRHCPYVLHVAAELARIESDYGDRVAIVGIASNDADAYPDDAPASMAAMAGEFGFRFPIGYDASQDVARAFAAACTPDFFLFDGDARLVYRGQLDGARPSNGVPVTGADLRAALDAVVAGRAIDWEQRPSMGCSIKWLPGGAPASVAPPPR
ncbi:MAG: thioredoxin family protein [Gemmatimonadota bacterium]